MELTRSALRSLSYAELGEILERLTGRVRRHLRATRGRVELVAPILRSGAVTGLHLASKLGVTRVLPLQFKHRETAIERLFAPPLLASPPPRRPTILLCDTNTVRAEIARLAVAELLALYPGATLLFASAVLDQGIASLAGVKAIFFGRLSNEARLLSVREARARSITNDVYVFPWETAAEQWRQIRAASLRQGPQAPAARGAGARGPRRSAHRRPPPRRG